MDTYLLTYYMEVNPSWEANPFSASQEIRAFFGTHRFITEFIVLYLCEYFVT